jgi:hypothetical protein
MKRILFNVFYFFTVFITFMLLVLYYIVCTEVEVIQTESESSGDSNSIFIL